MTSDAISEAATRTLQDEIYQYPGLREVTRLTTAVLATVTPLIRAEALEEAARLVAVSAAYDVIDLAAAIRALKEQP